MPSYGNIFAKGNAFFHSLILFTEVVGDSPKGVCCHSNSIPFGVVA
jgi:hypothetical protein